MEKLVTGTGKTIDCSGMLMSSTQTRAYIYITNISLVDAVQIFQNPNDTAQLRCGMSYLAHFTRLVSIAPRGENIRVVLGKE